MAMRRAGAGRRGGLVRRIPEAPDLARVVPGIEPAALHRLVLRRGLEDAGEIVAHATAGQLMRVFDADLWRSEAAGGEARFDADRFGLWLQVLADQDADAAARRLVEMDFHFVTTALSHLVHVQAPRWTEFEDAPPEWTEQEEAGLAYEIGGFTVVARRPEPWDAVLAVLASLDTSHSAFFARLMSACQAISPVRVEPDGFHHEVLSPAEEILDGVAAGREERREEEGYVTPAMAAAFLELARRAIEKEKAPPATDHVTAGYFSAMARRGLVTSVPLTRPRTGLSPDAPGALLPRDAGVGDRFPRIRARLLETADGGPEATARQDAELAFLANVLVAGGSLNSRHFRPAEAADAVLAACNLGLENWPHGWPSADLVTTFRLGWSLAHERACLHAARGLVEVLPTLSSDDEEIQRDLAALYRALRYETRWKTPWRVRESLDVLAILDPPSWAILLGLIDECPVLPQGVADMEGRSPSHLPTAIEFVSSNRQLAWVRQFVASLAERLAGLDGGRSPVV